MSMGVIAVQENTVVIMPPLGSVHTLSHMMLTVTQSTIHRCRNLGPLSALGYREHGW